MTSWYDNAMPLERLNEIYHQWSQVTCGVENCNCGPAEVIQELITEIRRLREIEDRMKGLEK